MRYVLATSLAVLSLSACTPVPHHKMSTFGLAPGSKPVPADAKPLTAQELRACVEDRKTVQQGAPGAQSAKDATAQKQAALKARQDELQQQQPQPGAPRSVILAYNAKVNALNADNKAYSSDVSATNGRIQGLNAAAAAFNTNCGGRSFSQDDAEIIMKDYPGVTL